MLINNKNYKNIKKLWNSTTNLLIQVPIIIPYSDQDFGDKWSENSKILTKELAIQKIIIKNYPVIIGLKEGEELKAIHVIMDTYLKQKLKEPAEIDSLKERIINIQKIFFKKIIS